MILPPPAPTLEISVDSALMTISNSISNESFVKVVPDSIKATSVEVPPTSQAIKYGTPIALPSCTQEEAPATGPAKSILYGICKDSTHGTKDAVQSAKFIKALKHSSFSPTLSTP